MKSLIERISDLEEKLAESEEAQATTILNQADIITKQDEQDAVLAEILLNGLGV